MTHETRIRALRAAVHFRKRYDPQRNFAYHVRPDCFNRKRYVVAVYASANGYFVTNV